MGNDSCFVTCACCRKKVDESSITRYTLAWKQAKEDMDDYVPSWIQYNMRDNAQRALEGG